jgi:hypothetical protein
LANNLFKISSLQLIIVRFISKSSVFYNKVKGMTKEALTKIGVNQLIILRPSLLLGVRSEMRIAERLSEFAMKAFGFAFSPFSPFSPFRPFTLSLPPHLNDPMTLSMTAKPNDFSMTRS